MSKKKKKIFYGRRGIMVYHPKFLLRPSALHNFCPLHISDTVRVIFTKLHTNVPYPISIAYSKSPKISNTISYFLGLNLRSSFLQYFVEWQTV